MLEDIGLTMTNYVVSSLKALIREKKAPFTLAVSEYITDEMILGKLAESEAEAADPNAKRFSHEEIFTPLREKYGYKI